MESILNAFMDEIVSRVIKKLEDNTSNMFNTLHLKVKAENVEGLDEAIKEIAEEEAYSALKNASFDISVNL